MSKQHRRALLLLADGAEEVEVAIVSMSHAALASRESSLGSKEMVRWYAQRR